MTIDERLGLTPGLRPTPQPLPVREGSDYSSQSEGHTNPLSPRRGAGGEAYAERKEQQKKVKRAEKAVKACEDKIAQMEARIKEMDTLLSKPEHATDMKLIEEYAQTMRQLDEENDRWMQLSEELEALQ